MFFRVDSFTTAQLRPAIWVGRRKLLVFRHADPQREMTWNAPTTCVVRRFLQYLSFAAAPLPFLFVPWAVRFPGIRCRFALQSRLHFTVRLINANECTGVIDLLSEIIMGWKRAHLDREYFILAKKKYVARFAFCFAEREAEKKEAKRKSLRLKSFFFLRWL